MIDFPRYEDVLAEIPKDFEDNGCTCAPNWLWSVGAVRNVCRAHDWLYELGGDAEDRLSADLMLRDGIARLARRHGIVIGAIGRAKAEVYFRAVRAVGWKFFAWERSP